MQLEGLAASRSLDDETVSRNVCLALAGKEDIKAVAARAGGIVTRYHTITHGVALASGFPPSLPGRGLGGKGSHPLRALPVLGELQQLA
jgi:hypothetical protein